MGYQQQTFSIQEARSVGLVDRLQSAAASKVTEWAGAGLGLLGAALNAVDVPHLAIPAYVIWVGSSTLLTCYGLATKSFGIMTMSLGYTALNVTGVLARI